MAQQLSDATICHHIPQAILRVFRIERHISTTGFQHRQQGNDHLDAVLERDHVPPGYRFYVRRYFQLIRPREETR